MNNKQSFDNEVINPGIFSTHKDDCCKINLECEKDFFQEGIHNQKEQEEEDECDCCDKDLEDNSTSTKGRAPIPQDDCCNKSGTSSQNIRIPSPETQQCKKTCCNTTEDSQHQNTEDLGCQDEFCKDDQSLIVKNAEKDTQSSKPIHWNIKSAIEDWWYQTKGYTKPSEDEETYSSLKLKKMKRNTKLDESMAITMPIDVSFFNVEGMTCTGCVSQLESHLRSVPGIQDTKISLLTHKAEISYYQGMLTEMEISHCIEQAGFTSQLLNEDSSIAVLLVDTSHSKQNDHLAKSITSGLTKMDGVVTVKTEHPDQNTLKVTVNYDPDITGVRFIKETTELISQQPVTLAGSIDSNSKETKSQNELKWQNYLLICTFLTVPLIILRYILPYVSSINSLLESEIIGGLSVVTLISFLLTTPIQFGIGQSLYLSAYQSVKYAKMANMDFLVMLSTTVAYVFSVISAIVSMATQRKLETFFETSAILLTLIILGRYMEILTKDKAGNILKTVLLLQPSHAVLVTLKQPLSKKIKSNVESTCNLSKQASNCCDEKSNTISDCCDKETDHCNNNSNIKSCSKTNTSDKCSQNMENHDFGKLEIISEQLISVDYIHRGDVIKVTSGSKIPCDGIIVEGNTHVDESMVTGESLPISKKPGDHVIGGTINQNGLIYIRVDRLYNESFISSIYKLIESAQATKTDVQRIADIVAGYFVPCIVVLSIITFVVWFIVASNTNIYTNGLSDFAFALFFAITVLIISCPCAISLASPTAILVGTSMAAKFGIILKSGVALEKAFKTKIVVFDKTGTVTLGKPTVTDCISFSPKYDTNRILYYAACCERGSSHVIGQAIVKYAEERLKQNISEFLAPLDFDAFQDSNGVRCLVDGHTIIIGNEQCTLKHGIKISIEISQNAALFQNEGKTIVFVSLDGELAGMIALIDQPREEAAFVIHELKKMGMDVWMLSGDNQKSVERIAQQIGIEISHAVGGLLPSHKTQKIKELQLGGNIVSMIGDGVNDSAALVQSDVGIAVTNSTDVALEAASVVMLKHNLSDLLILFDVSRVTFRQIKRNFMWAFFFNLVGIPLSAGLLWPTLHIAIPPAIAGISELFSSVPVILLSLTLQWYKLPSSRRIIQ